MNSSRLRLWCVVFACGFLLLTWVGVAAFQSGIGPVNAVLALVGATAVAASAVVACLTGRKSSRSIRDVTEGIGRIDAGDLDHRIRAESSGDTGEARGRLQPDGDLAHEHDGRPVG